VYVYLVSVQYYDQCMYTWFQLFNLKSAMPEPITGIEFDRMPSDSMTEYQYYILVTTPGYVIV